ncbi:hypothetical protein C2E21_6404 [Chlorella sorokiniana]|uniref:Uncharacterized protein n=1 Tax=Chlorella sorokiniana TaxID=3076 RepID=A0A2P6TLE0_CHLSO|nr:hypothetical protein C2E21_6404 [Chlorella sorokiniana]|eukprot:PRW45085.1 hypothetical protein C2E21_6404 [Chlorella sorokiniana]
MQSATLSRAQAVRCNAQTQPQQQQQAPAAAAAVPQRRRLLLAGLGTAALALRARPAAAAFPGIESVELPTVDVPAAIAEKQARNQAVLDAAEKSFQESDLLRTLKERSEANRDSRKRALEDKYCMRQAELGVGDCGGLRYIPGMTKSGVQKRPEWMEKLFGMEGKEWPAQRCWSGYSRLGSAGGSSDSEGEGSPAAAAMELARVRRQLADIDQKRVVLQAELGALEERQEALYDEEDALSCREDALFEEELALAERQRQLAEQLETLVERQEALFETEEALAEQERQLQSLLGSQESGLEGSMDAGGGFGMGARSAGRASQQGVGASSSWSVDRSGASGGEERQDRASSFLEEASEDEDEWDPNREDILRAKWILDGCSSLAQCRERLGEQIVWLQQLEDEGWELQGTVEEDYGTLWRELPDESSGEAEQ